MIELLNHLASYVALPTERHQRFVFLSFSFLFFPSISFFFFFLPTERHQRFVYLSFFLFSFLFFYFFLFFFLPTERHQRLVSSNGLPSRLSSTWFYMVWHGVIPALSIYAKRRLSNSLFHRPSRPRPSLLLAPSFNVQTNSVPFYHSTISTIPSH